MAAVRPAAPEPSTARRVEMLFVMPQASRARQRPPQRPAGGELNRAATANQGHHDHDDRNDEQDVDEPAAHVEGEGPKKPQDEQDDGNRPKHGSALCFDLDAEPKRASYLAVPKAVRRLAR